MSKTGKERLLFITSYKMAVVKVCADFPVVTMNLGVRLIIKEAAP